MRFEHPNLLWLLIPAVPALIAFFWWTWRTKKRLISQFVQSRLLATTLSTITDFAYTFDRDGRFVYVNQALLDLWGLKLEDAVGRNFFDLKYPDELAARLQRQIRVRSLRTR